MKAPGTIARMSPAAIAAWASDALRLAADGVVAQGAAAFDCPRSAAALHEAGHCVVYRAEGEHVTVTRIWHEFFLDRRNWLGLTKGTGRWRVAPDTPPADDLRQARFHLAGVCAELAFEGDQFRAASSVEEIAVARQIILSAAAKLDVEFAPLMAGQFLLVTDILGRHRATVDAIARELIRRGSLKGARLERLLAGVKACLTL